MDGSFPFAKSEHDGVAFLDRFGPFFTPGGTLFCRGGTPKTCKIVVLGTPAPLLEPSSKKVEKRSRNESREVPGSPDKGGGPALRTNLPDVLRDDRALEALHFVPRGHGGGYNFPPRKLDYLPVPKLDYLPVPKVDYLPVPKLEYLPVPKLDDLPVTKAFS